MNNIEKLLDFEKSGAFSICAITEQIANKKSRLTKEKTPAHLQVVYKLVYITVSLGNDYQQAVNNRLAKEGKEEDFQSESTYTLPYKNSKIVLKHKFKEQLYLRVYPNLAHSFHTRKEYFDSNGNHISYKKFKQLQKEYFKLPSNNAKQGLDDSIIVNNYKIENIKWVKRGSIKIEEIKLEQFKEMIDSQDINIDRL